MKKFIYYATNHISKIIPKIFFEVSLKSKLKSIDQYDKDYIMYRVNYYNKTNIRFKLSNPYSWKSFSKNTVVTDVENPSIIIRNTINSAYYNDFMEYLRFFDKSKTFNVAFYDLTKIPTEPLFVKSRPISGENHNSVLLKLDKLRHFRYVRDNLMFEDKKNAIVFRGQCGVPHRKIFIEKYHGMKNSDFGDSHKLSIGQAYSTKHLSINDQLKYKYILSIEGVDVATNLKWIMNSNSLCFMVKPKYETWFMEGDLIPDYHYVLLKDDYSDIEKKMDYYNYHQNDALKIIKNANEYVNQFKDKKRESLISLYVMRKYFDLCC
jgi:hypothetical protein